MYKYNETNSAYEAVIAEDYVGKGFYYYTTHLRYVPITTGDNGNYSRDR